MKSLNEATSAFLPPSYLELPSWPCPGKCGETMRSADGKPAWTGSCRSYADSVCCNRCAPRMIARHLPRSEVLRSACAPAQLDRTFRTELVPNPNESNWPRDPRAPDLDLESWDGSPPLVTLTGPNGRGKSMLAVELLVRLFRVGRCSQFWVRPSQLVDEHFRGVDRYLRGLAENVGVLVLDEFGRGQHTNDFAHALVGEVIDHRLASTTKITLITTNLVVSSTAGGASIEKADSAVFDRLMTGLMIRMSGPSYRDLNSTDIRKQLTANEEA